MLYFIGAVIALGLLITVHELGHFLMARFFGVVIEKFSIGFGPKLISFRKKDTEYRISLIPLGGYVKMKGENPDEEYDENEVGTFKSKPWWQRALIAFSGPMANLFFALFIFILSFLVGKNFEDQYPIIGKFDQEQYSFFQLNDRIIELNEKKIQSWNQLIKYTEKEGSNTFLVDRDGETFIIETDEILPETWISEILPYAQARIGEVTPGYPAYKAGLMPGDEILMVSGKEVTDWYTMRELIISSTEESVTLKIRRDDQIFDKKIKLEENILADNRIIGIMQYLPAKIKEKYSFLESVKYGSYTTISFVLVNYSLLYRLLSNPSALKSNIGGPVMIITMSQQTVKKGLDTVLSFIAAISIILMIMNLLPIPILDGGQIFFCIIEGIFRKPLPMKIQIVLQNIGIVILVSLMIFAFFNDFNRIFSRNISIKEQKSNELNFNNIPGGRQ